MAVDTTKLRQERNEKIEACRAILDKATGEKRATTAEEDEQYDRLWKAAEDQRKQIEGHERQNELERAEAEMEARKRDERRDPRLIDEHRREDEMRRQLATDDDNFLDPDDFMTEEARVRRTREYHRGFLKRVFGRVHLITEEEHRAQVAGKAEKGGYFYTSEQFINELLKDVDDAVMVRQLARKFRIPGNDSIGVPTITSKMSDADWTSELGVPSRDKIVFGKRALTPHPLAKEVPVSKVLVRKAPDIVSIVRGELARVVGTAEENAAMTGTGDNQWLGMFTASNDGIGTARDVTTGNTGTLVQPDNLYECQFTLKQAYWPGARWVFNRVIMKQIAKLKDGEGRYLLQPVLTAGAPLQSLIGFPVILSEYAPSTASSGNYAGILGDFRFYWVVDGLDTEIQRAEELLIRENQDLFIIRAYSDGAPVKAEAFVRSKFA